MLLDEDYTPTADALQEADEIIEKMLEHCKLDYRAARNELAEMFDSYIWNGNTDMTTDLEDLGLRDLLLIQEDHYDQHMDLDDDKPSWDKMLFMAGAYVWFSDDTQ